MIKVIENTISEKDLEQIRNIIGQPEEDIIWYLNKDITIKSDTKALININSVPTYQISHPIYERGRLTYQSYKFIYDLIDDIFKRNGCYGRLARVKLNILFNHRDMTEDKYNTPHVDMECEHYNMIIFLNDSDGDTVFFNEYFSKNLNDVTVRQRISPKPNRSVISDGLMHTSSNPLKNDIRVVLNAVLEKTINKINKE